MGILTRRQTILAAVGASAMDLRPARAESARLRVSYGYSTSYLPLMVMRDQGLIEKHAAKIGLGKVAVEWQVLDGGNNINDAMLAGALDIAGIGIPGYLVLRDRTLGKPQEMTAISALNAGALWLNTIDPRIKALTDYGPGDRIAVPGIKTSYAAVVLEMAAAKTFGIANYAKLDPLTVGLPHPDAYAAMMSGKTEIKSHFASPPFSYQELRNPKVHRVLTTADVIGLLTILLNMTQKRFASANPGMVKAFLAAQEEANGFIAHDREGAVTAYGRGSKLKMPRADLLEILADPETSYSTVPKGSLVYASFLAQAGVVKVKPAAWTDLFLPDIGGMGGS
jgi:NitT/TauT family transport system substrate-binding protein